jgi:hypothetical protein
MNLPAFYLADLPPEATLTPRVISAACDALKRNREKNLRSRNTEDIVRLLCEIATDWLDPENRFRQLALAQGPAETGFSKAVLAKGLDGFFRQFTPDNFRALLAQELGDAVRVTGDPWRTMEGGIATDGAASAPRHFWRGPELLVHIAAGNLPNPALMSLARDC